MDNWNGKRNCRGEFKTLCSDPFDVEIDDDWSIRECECDSQLIVNGECNDAFFCLRSRPRGGYEIICEANEILRVRTEKCHI